MFLGKFPAKAQRRKGIHLDLHFFFAPLRETY